MMSATREERIVIVTGIIAGFVGLALGLAHGGLASRLLPHGASRERGSVVVAG